MGFFNLTRSCGKLQLKNYLKMPKYGKTTIVQNIHNATKTQVENYITFINVENTFFQTIISHDQSRKIPHIYFLNIE